MSRRDAPDWAKTLTDLRSLSDDELVSQHDRLALGETGRPQAVRVDYYLAELARRDTARAMDTMRRLTWAILLLTVVNVGVVVASLYG